MADLEKIQNAREDLWNPAAAKYREKSDAYDRLLGDFIPRILRDRIRSELAYNAYTGGSNASASDDWDMYRIRLRERRQKNMPALSTGIPALDRLIGGLPKLAVLAGVAGAGKTALALSMTVGALHAHPDVAAVFYSLDMAKDVIYDRLLCHQSGLNYREVLRNYDDPSVTCQLSEAEAKLAVAILPRLRVVERGQLGGQKDQLVQALIQHGLELKQKCGVKRALHVIDYFQILSLAKSANNPNEADYQRIAVLQAAQEATCSPDCPEGDCFLVLSEVRKGESGRSRLSLDDLLGSARIAYSADCVLLLEPDAESLHAVPDSTPLLLTVAKGRDGMTRGTVRLAFEFHRHRFLETTPPRFDDSSSPTGRERAASPSPSRATNPLAGGFGN